MSGDRDPTEEVALDNSRLLMAVQAVNGGQSTESGDCDPTDEVALDNSGLLMAVQTGNSGQSMGSAADDCDWHVRSEGLAVDTLGTRTDVSCGQDTDCRADDAELHTWSLVGRANAESLETARAEPESDTVGLSHSGSEISDGRRGMYCSYVERKLDKIHTSLFTGPRNHLVSSFSLHRPQSLDVLYIVT